MTARKILADMFSAIGKFFKLPNDGGHLVHGEPAPHISPYMLMIAMPPRR
jgi:hypothetical protein